MQVFALKTGSEAMEIKGTSDVGALSHHILSSTGNPLQKHYYFWRKRLLSHFGLLLLNTSTQASPLIYCCVCLLVSYKQDPHPMNEKNPMWVKGPRKEKRYMPVTDPGNCQNLTSYFRYTMCSNTYLPCSELWSTLWRISAWEKQLAVSTCLHFWMYKCQAWKVTLWTIKTTDCPCRSWPFYLYSVCLTSLNNSTGQTVLSY